VGCGKGETPPAKEGLPSADGSASALSAPDAGGNGPSATTDDDGAAPRAKAPLTFNEAVRLLRWDEAELAIAAWPDADKQKPEVRFTHARVLMKRGNYKDARAALEKLEDALPLLTDSIQRQRAEAELEVGPFEGAAEFFMKRGTPSAWLSAATGFERAQKPDRAIAACDRVLSEPKRTRKEETAARRARLRLAAPKAQSTLDDARWLAIHAEEPDVETQAANTLEQVDPQHPLTGPELIERSQTLSDGGHTDAALTMVDRAGSAPKAMSQLEVCRARADVLFKAKSRYQEAAATYGTCSNRGGPHAAEDAFLSARALARAEKDNEAIYAWTKLRERFPKTSWAEQATFFAARTHALHGQWKEASAAFDDYKKSFPGGQSEKDAERFRAISHFENKEYKLARRLFEELAGETTDSSQQARWSLLAALAAREAGDKTQATARYLDVARNKPLSYASLVARARLAETQTPFPSTIEPFEGGPAPPPLVVKLPPPVDMLHAMGLDRDAEDFLRERESLVKGEAPGRGTEALCMAYNMLGRAKRLHSLALEIPAAMLATAPGPKNRWAWDCAYPEPYAAHVRDDEAKDQLPENLVYAVMRQESGFDPDVVSPAGAVGLMQLMPETARVTAESTHMEHREQDLTVVPHNIALGSHYLHELFVTFDKEKRSKQAAVPLVIASYNAGPEAIVRWLSRSPGMPLEVFVERIPYTETRGYVVKVLGNLARYGYRAHGEAGVPQLKLDLAPE
jgi:soluble lytic murein transglycosylase